MAAMGATATLTDAELNSEENRCPAGGTYTLETEPRGGSCTISCSDESHGKTTILLKNGFGVTAQVDKEKKVPMPTMTPPPADNGLPGTSEPETSNPEVKENISVSLVSCSIYVRDTCTMTPTVTPDVPCTFSWSVTSGSEYATIDAMSGVVTGIAVGTATVTCTATPLDGSKYVGSSTTAQVTVNEKKPVSVIVSPKEITIEEGETYWSVSATPQNCNNPSSYTWTSNDTNIATVTEEGWNSRGILAKHSGTCTITCKMGYYQDGLSGEQYTEDTLTVHVIEKSVPTGDLFANLPNPLRINGGTGKELNMNEYLAPGVTGQWSVVEGPVTTGEYSSYIGTTGEAGNFKLKFTASDGREQIVEGVVVFPHTSFGTNPEKSFSMTLDEEKDINTRITAYSGNNGETTDGPVIWENDEENPGVVGISWSGDKDRVAHVKALGIGTATITAKLQNGYDDTWTVCPVTITVNSKKVASISAADLNVQEDGTAQIQVSYEPTTGIDLSKVSLSYACYSELATVSDTGLVTGINDGTCDVTVTASGDGVENKNRTATCKVTVTDNPKRIKRIWAETSPISLELGQDPQPINIQHEPEDADTADVRYTYESYNGSFIDVSENGMVTPKAEGETEITIRAYKGSIYLAECKVKVSVIDPSKLTGISLNTEYYEMKNGEEATVALSPGSGQIIVSPVPETADMSGAEILLEYYESVVEVSKIDATSWKIKGKNVGKAYIKVKAHQGNIWVEKNLEVNVIDNPEKLSGILVQPSEIDIMEGEKKNIALKLSDESSGDVLISPIPKTASLEGAEFSCSANSDYNISVADNVITGMHASESWSDVRVNIKLKKGDDTFEGSLKVNVKQDPTRLQSFWITPNPMVLDVNETKPFTIGTNPEGVDLSVITFRYTPDDASVVSIDAEKGEVTGLKYGTTNVKAEAIKNGAVLAECSFVVKVTRLTNMWVTPGQVALTPGESTTVQVGYEPWDASGLVFDIAKNNADFFDYLVDGANITITGKSQGDSWVPVQAKDAATDAVMYEVGLNVKVNRIKSINVVPNPVAISKNQIKEFTLEIDPPNADLSDVTFELDSYVSSDLKVIQPQNGKISFQAFEQTGERWTNLYAKVNGETVAQCSLRVYVADDPNHVYEVQFDPNNVLHMNVGETKRVAIYPGEGDIVVIPIMAGINTSEVSVNYNNLSEAVVINSATGEITANKLGYYEIQIIINGISKTIQLYVT